MKTLSTLLAAALCLLLTPDNLFASHMMGQDLEYTYIGDSAGHAQYRVKVHHYRDCAGISSPSYITLQWKGLNCGLQSSVTLALDSFAMPANGTDITQVCNAQLSSTACGWTGIGTSPYPGAQIYTYTGVVSVPFACSEFRIGTNECCRNAAITNLVNASSFDLALSATINNSIDPLTGQPYRNNSVVFNMEPVILYCINSTVIYDHGAVDADGDSLVYSLTDPLSGTSLSSYTAIAFAAGYSVNFPIKTSPPNSFHLDSRTGQMTFVPSTQEQDVLALKIEEYRNGVLIGSTMRDMQLVMMNCAVSLPSVDGIRNLQNAMQTDSNTIRVCPGSALQFDVLCTDANHLNITTRSTISSVPSAIPGATATAIGTGNSVSVHVQWTPQLSDSGCHSFKVEAENDDCPVLGRYSKVFNICVGQGVLLTASGPTYCGSPVQLQASGGDNFTWIPSSGPDAVSDPGSYSPTVSPVNPTTYYFSSDCGSDSVFVNVSAPFQLDLGNDTLLCSSNMLQLNASTTSPHGNLSYTWSSTNGSVPNNTSANPLVNVARDNTYLCQVTDSFGCTASDLIHVTSAKYNSAEATASDTSGCQASITLSPILSQGVAACGTGSIPYTGTISTFQVGNGTGLMPPGSPVTYPALYANYRQGSRTQFLYKRDELLQILGGPGQISGLAFDITQFNSSDPIINFQISIACTQTNSLTAWEGPTFAVFFRDSVYPTLGWNHHAFDNFYNWDGNSNLIVEVCSYNPFPSPVLNNKVSCRSVTYQSVWYSNGNSSQCGYTGSPSGRLLLPNIQLDFCREPLANASILWSSVSQPNRVIDSTALSPIVAAPTSGIYYFEIYDSLCQSVITDSVEISSASQVTVTIDTAICQGESYFFNSQNLTQAGSYLEQLTSGGGCDSIVTLNLSVHPLPAVTLSGNPDTVCNTTVAFALTGESPIGGTFTGNGVSNSIFDPLASGIGPALVYYTYTDANGCINFASEAIQVDSCGPNCKADFVVYPDPLIQQYYYGSNLSIGNNLSYMWYFGDGDSSSLQYPTHNYAQPGMYYVCLTVNDGAGCIDTYCDSSFYVFKTEGGLMSRLNIIDPNLPVGITEKDKEVKILLYPNPATDQLNIDLGSIQVDGLRLLASDGRLMSDIKALKNNQVDISRFTAGVYIAEIRIKDIVKRIRWVKM